MDERSRQTINEAHHVIDVGLARSSSPDPYRPSRLAHGLLKAEKERSSITGVAPDAEPVNDAKPKSTDTSTDSPPLAGVISQGE
jgi:hypothetical protein